MGDRLDQEGLIRIAWNDGRAGIASDFPASAGVEVEVGFEFFGVGRVTLKAVFGEEGADVGFEILQAGSVIGAAWDHGQPEENRRDSTGDGWMIGHGWKKPESGHPFYY